jgi:uncharacterized protein YkwD
MTNIFRRAGIIAAMSVAMLGGTALGASPVSAATTSTDASYEAKIISLTNAARVKNGCAAVRTQSKLTTSSRVHSTDMVRKNFFGHIGSDGSTFVVRAKRAGYTSPLSENIAWGYRTPEIVVGAWMKSAGHRANILNCKAKAVGVGVYRKADGTPYWTQVFGSV